MKSVSRMTHSAYHKQFCAIYEQMSNIAQNDCRSTMLRIGSVKQASTVHMVSDEEDRLDKQIATAAEAVANIHNGAVVMIGGFGGSGAPIELIHALIDKGAKDLTVINNNAGNGRIGIAAMIDAGLVRKMICSFPRSSDPRAFTDRYLAGEIELELVPQGTLAERIRAGGAGIPAFYTPTGYGTELAHGKVVAEFDGRPYVQERWLKADFALIKAHLGDNHGNLTYRKAGRNFNPLMCMAAKQTIVQVSKLVAPGKIDPEQVVTPGIFVNQLVEIANPAQEEDLIRAGVVYQ
jgi:3-oxoadipate CoA-transferase alpha subunit